MPAVHPPALNPCPVPAADVRLNGTPVARLDGADRERRGHIALQNHHEGSAVRFRDLKIQRLG